MFWNLTRYKKKNVLNKILKLISPTSFYVSMWLLEILKLHLWLQLCFQYTQFLQSISSSCPHPCCYLLLSDDSGITRTLTTPWVWSVIVMPREQTGQATLFPRRPQTTVSGHAWHCILSLPARAQAPQPPVCPQSCPFSNPHRQHPMPEKPRIAWHRKTGSGKA